MATIPQLHADQEAEFRAFVAELIARFHPLKVILFGSRATGVYDEDSDWDLFVVMEDAEDPIAVAGAIREAIPRRFPLDLLVREPSTFAWRLAQGDQFLKAINTNGVVLYESPDR